MVQLSLTIYLALVALALTVAGALGLVTRRVVAAR